jgi:DNA-directed RNA polymerase subunit RPC12/RpoP
MDKLGGPQISLQDTTAVKCEKCGGEIFESGMILREVSALMTGTGQPGIIPIPVFICSKCGHVNSQFIPQELRDNGIVEAQL